jgi:hypothetical protein
VYVRMGKRLPHVRQTTDEQWERWGRENDTDDTIRMEWNGPERDSLERQRARDQGTMTAQGLGLTLSWSGGEKYTHGMNEERDV